MDLHFNPRNSVYAIFYFLFGTFFTWWSIDKIDIFTSFFGNNLPKIFIWITFITLFATWLILVPLLCLLGKEITIIQFTQIFIRGFIGIAAIIILLPISSILIPVLEEIFQNTFITGLVYLTTFMITAYLALYRPIGVLYETH